MRNLALRASVALLLIVSFSIPPQALAWHAVGHMAVAYVAYQQLTAKTKKRVAVLLKLNPYYSKWQAFLPKGASPADTNQYLFMMAATWPDEIKAIGSGYHGNDDPPHDFAEATANGGYTDKDMRKYWHFIDVGFEPTGTTLPLPATPQVNSQVLIALLRAAIQSKNPDPLKSYDLVWLEHLVGDAHQPLHCVTRVVADLPKGDEGGNSIDITPGDNLHSFWDDLPGSGDTSDFLKAVTYAKALAAAPEAQATITNEATWTQQCTALGERVVYLDPVDGSKGPFTLTDDYKTKASGVANTQVALAGARLAKLLNDNLK